MQKSSLDEEYWSLPARIILYDDPSSPTLDITEIRDYLEHTIEVVSAEVREEFVTYHLKGSRSSLAAAMAKGKVRDVNSPGLGFPPLPAEVKFEENIMAMPEKPMAGILYDGFYLVRTLRELIPASEVDLSILHIVFTSRLLGTYDYANRRYHARVLVCGYPHIISTTGIVEAPAKPKRYYVLRRTYEKMGMEIPPEILKEKFEGRFIDYEDERLTEVLKGYVMQAFFHSLIGEAFCRNPDCRLFDSHWQEEVLRAQLGDVEFCEEHLSILQDFKSRMS